MMGDRVAGAPESASVDAVGSTSADPSPTGEPGDESSDPSASEISAEPEPGECRNYAAEAIPPPTNDSPLVDCAEEHTAYTFYVGSTDARNRRAVQEVSSTCGRFWRLEIGSPEKGDEFASVASYAFFFPDDAAWAAGERWYRCDLVAGIGELLPLPDDRHDLMTDSGPGERFGACLRLDPDVVVSCRDDHDMVFADVAWLRSDGFPGRKPITERATEECPRIVGSDLTWYATWQAKQLWVDGRNPIFCWDAPDMGA